MENIEIFKIFGSFAINGVEEATKSLNKIDGIGAKVGKGISNLAKGVGKSMAVVGTAVGAGAVAFGTFATNSALELEATQAKFDTVFGEFADQANETYKEISKLTPMTKAEFNDMSSGLQDMIQPITKNRELSTELTSEIMHLTGALTNFNSSQYSAKDVSGKFAAALRGEYSVLADFGVEINKEIVQLKAVELGLADTTKEVSKQAEMQAMLAIVTESSGDALAAYNEESLDTKTKIGLLKAEFTTMASEMALGVLPSIMNLVDMAFPLLQQVLESLMPVFDIIIEKLLPPLIKLLENVLPVVTDLIDIFISWVTDGFGKTNPAIEQFVNDVLPPIMNTLKEVWDLTKEFITDVVQMFKGWYNENKETIDGFVTFIKNVLIFAIENLPAVFETVFGLLKNILKFFQDNAINVIETVTGVFEGISEFISGVFSGDWEKAWSGIVKVFKSYFGGITNFAKNTLNGAIGIINSFIRGINKIKIPDWVSGIGGKGINIPTIPMLAEGGNIIRAGQAIVGEAGPELINLPRGARVTPLTDGQGNSVTGDTYNITINASDGNDVVEKMDRWLYNKKAQKPVTI